MNHTTEQLVIELSKKLIAREWKLVTAESCTGGGLAYALTHLAGSSNWFERGFVSYSNLAKEELLGVSPVTLATYGAVSEETAREMADGALRNSQAQLSISVTGIAGPDGGTKDKPIGTVWIAYASTQFETVAYLLKLSGSRSEIRLETIRIALENALKLS